MTFGRIEVFCGLSLGSTIGTARAFALGPSSFELAGTWGIGDPTCLFCMDRCGGGFPCVGGKIGAARANIGTSEPEVRVRDPHSACGTLTSAGEDDHDAYLRD